MKALNIVVSVVKWIAYIVLGECLLINLRRMIWPESK